MKLLRHYLKYDFLHPCATTGAASWYGVNSESLKDAR